jgi:hypothetical protein
MKVDDVIMTEIQPAMMAPVQTCTIPNGICDTRT